MPGAFSQLAVPQIARLDFPAQIVAAGPDAEPDLSGNVYWVEELDSMATSGDATDGAGLDVHTDGRIVAAEWLDGSDHSLAVGQRVHVFPLTDRAAAPKARWFFSLGGGAGWIDLGESVSVYDGTVPAFWVHSGPCEYYVDGVREGVRETFHYTGVDDDGYALELAAAVVDVAEDDGHGRSILYGSDANTQANALLAPLTSPWKPADVVSWATRPTGVGGEVSFGSVFAVVDASNAHALGAHLAWQAAFDGAPWYGVRMRCAVTNPPGVGENCLGAAGKLLAKYYPSSLRYRTSD